METGAAAGATAAADEEPVEQAADQQPVPKRMTYGEDRRDPAEPRLAVPPDHPRDDAGSGLRRRRTYSSGSLVMCMEGSRPLMPVLSPLGSLPPVRVL